MSTALVNITDAAEALILYIARASSNQENTNPGLLRYLIENNHWSPFEHAHATFEFITDKAIAIQMLRHRSFSFQEFSQRYASPTEYVLNSGRLSGETNRQSSVEQISSEDQGWWTKEQERVYLEAFGVYQAALDRGIHRECARSVLPMATKTKLYMTGSIRSWIHYFRLRCDEHAQLEHQQLAMEARAILAEHLPNIAVACDW